MSMLSENKVINEVHLWISFVKGDKEAFSEFYELIYPKLYAYGMRLRMDEEHIRDIIQDISIKLYTKSISLNDNTKILSYLFMSFRNAFLGHEAYRKKYIDIQEIEDFDLRFTIEETALEDEEEKQKITRKVKTILDSLTPRQREIIYLRFLYQMEYEEISRIMNMSGQAARNLIYRAIDSIRKNNLYLFITILP